MRLTLHTDYALRVLIYLASTPEETVSIPAIASAYGISQNHLVKVAQSLKAAGYVETIRGHTGGLRLARDPEKITVGAVVRVTEPDLALVDCLHDDSSECPIDGACGLKSAVVRARSAFLEVLDQVTVSSLTRGRRALVRRLGIPLSR